MRQLGRTSTQHASEILMRGADLQCVAVKRTVCLDVTDPAAQSEIHLHTPKLPIKGRVRGVLPKKLTVRHVAVEPGLVEHVVMHKIRHAAVVLIDRHFVPSAVQIQHTAAAEDIEIVLIGADRVKMIFLKISCLNAPVFLSTTISLDEERSARGS